MKYLKKLLVSGMVILAFFLYSLHQRGEIGDETNTVTPVVTPTLTITTNPTTLPQKTGQFRDGTYTGDVTDAYYGNIQVQAIINGGRLADVKFLQYPNDRDTSISINTMAMPILKARAISLQDANVDIVSGASDTSLAFVASLQSALNKAK